MSSRKFVRDWYLRSYAAFLTAINAGRVKAEDLVKKAIGVGRLAPETIEDRAYLYIA